MKSLIFFIISIFSCIYLSYAVCTLPAPTGLKSSNIASCEFKVKWDVVAAAESYNIQYKLSSESNWTLISAGNKTNKTLTGLISNATYQVKVAAVCTGGEVGSYSAAINVTTLLCSKPTDITFTEITASGAKMSWAVPCGEAEFTVKYRKLGSSGWTVINGLTNQQFVFTNLENGTTYETKVASVCGSNSKYASIKNFTTLVSDPVMPGKNVLLIIIDDARFDTYTANNGPSFFADTNISRIANEGINFKLTFPALSMCAPSRASIVTGTYPHIHGVTDNPNNGKTDTVTIATLPQILQSNGYYTGLIGKYHLSKFPQPGYDFWMECHDNDYFDTRYNINGKNKKILGHQTDIVTDSTLGFLKKVPAGKPFFLWVGYRAPHYPFDEARPEDKGLFDNDVMPYPANNERYTVNYPGFLYDCHNAVDSAQMITKWRGYFELLQGVEHSMGRIYNKLSEMGILDSTMIIFVSDNGFMFGEHDFEDKQIAYEESIKVPLFIRYPKIFPAGKLVKKQIAMNIDIAPTILDFAGIPQTYGMQGVSLIKMYKNEVSRTEMMYEFINKKCVPDLRAVRSLDYKYVQYNCNQATEEFFDLNADKKENTNQINNPAYAALVNEYRDKLTFWRSYYNDTAWDSLYTCSLTNPQRLERENNLPLMMLNVYPSPVSDEFRLSFISEEYKMLTVSILSPIGQIEWQENFNEPTSEFSKSFNTTGMSPGVYTVLIQHGERNYQRQFVVQR